MLAAGLFAGLSCCAAEVRKVVGAGGAVTYTNVVARQSARQPAVANDVLPPEVIGAVANVLGVAHLVSKSRDFCGNVIPASSANYRTAAQAWELRNASVVLQKNRVMAGEEQRMVADALAGDATRKIDEMLRPVVRGSGAEQAAWCKKAFADINRGTLDLVGRMSIAPLMRAGR